MKKGNKTRIVSAWLLLLMWFGMSATSWAADSDIVTSVTYNEKDTTFTIRRSDTTKATWVNYRTLDGTAIGGQHFDHKAGRLYFEHGVFEQKVKMKEYGAGTSIYAYGNNVNRVYYFEAWNSFCEPIIASSREITNPYSYTSHNDGWRTLNLGGDFWWNDDYDVWRECYLSNAISASENQYRKATGQVDWWYEFYTDFHIEHRDNGWYHAWFYWGGNQIHSFTYEDAWSGWYREPGGTFWKRVSDCNDYGYKFQVKWRSDGNGDDYSKIAELYLRCRYVDSQKPSPIKLACNTLYPYASGDELYVSVCYNEIVNFTQNQTSYIIYSNIGDLEYISGAGTNVLSFKTKINKAEDVSGLKITGANFTLKDIAGNQQSSLTASNDNFQYKSSYINTSSISTDIWKKEVKLSWSNNQAKDVDGFWYIYRYKTDEGPSKGQFTDEYPSTDFPYPFLNSETEGGKASYTDHSEDLLYDVSYTYIFQYVPKTWSDVKQLFLDRFIIQPNKLERKFNINLSITSHEDHISLNWNSDQFQDDKQHEFRIFRKEGAKGKFVEIAKVGSNMESTYDYDDYDISSGCATYYYKVTTSSLFPDKNYPSGLEYSSDTTKSGSMTTESQVLSLEATKGTYSNTVKLTWNARQTGTDETKYVIYRRDLNSDDSWVKLHTTSGTATVYAFDDNTALPGKYYEYKVASSFICSETGLETDPVEVFDDGFCRALGVISGRVTYGTGSAVNNAKVSVVKNSDSDIKQFHSLRVNGAGSGIQLPIDKKQGAEYFNKPWTIQLYVNPDASISDAKGKVTKNIPLVKSAGNFGFYLAPKNSNEYYVSVLGPSSELQKTSLLIEANQFSHLTFSYDGKSKITARLTDEYGKITKASKTIQTIDFKLENDSVETSPLLFGKSTNNEEVFKGYLDDIRIFSDKELSDQEILSNYNRILSGSESKLILYWPMDEGIRNQKRAYDYSKTSGVTNDNHGEIFAGSSISSENIPTDSQLSIFGVTDTMGNYTINGIPFEGEGTTYMVIPSLGIHKFSPQYATRFVSASSLVHSGVDFEDVSSFPISGIVTYHNTNYPVEGANIYVDGVVCSKDGEMITTDANGEFTVSVPIGDHHIQVKMKDHVFVNNGRFPSNSLLEYTFDRELSEQIEFFDSTFVTLTGRVAGGLPESKKPHGFGTGNATIGKATIELTFGEKSQFNLSPDSIRTYGNPSKSVNSIATTGKYDTPSSRSIIIHTDSATGEFAVSLPPVDYKVKSVKVDNNPDIAFSTENIEAILFGSGSLQTQTDSLVVSEGDTATFDYLYALDLIYRSNPVLELTSLSTPDGAFGDKEYIIKDDATGISDTIPLYSLDSTTGKITYTLGYPIYTQGKKYDHKMYLYEPYSNFDSIVNGAKIERFVKIPLQGAAISVSNSLGATMVATTDGIDEKGNEVKAGQVMETANSSLTADSMGYVDYTFMATYPNIVEPYTLGLNINFEYGETTYEWAQNNKFSGIVTGGLSSGSNFITSGPDKVLYVLRDPPGTGSSAHIEKGQTITTSSKISTEYNSEYSANVTWKLGADVTSAAGIGFAVITENSVKADITAGVEISYNSTHERTNTYKLTTTENISTSDASDYVGEDGDVYIGSATNIIMGKCRKVAPVKDEEGNYSIDMVEAISLGEEFTTQFKYTQNYIESILIPNLEMTRNSFLKKVSKAEYNKNYKNNSDKTIYITTKNKGDKDFGSEGSYICIPLDPKNYTDTIGYFNTQIKLWKDQLAYNEQAKVKAIETVTDYNEEEYNLAAKKIEEAKMLENTTFLLFDPYVQHYVKLDSTFWFNKKGGSIKYADYGSNKAMINNILDGYSISRSEYEKYLSTSKDKRNITLFYDTKKYGWKVKNVSFDAGTSIEESVERCGTVSSTDATNTQGLAVVGGKTGFAFCGLGFECELQTKQGGTEAFEESSETENCTAVGYTLADDGINDAMSVDIFQAPDGFGPIFYTRAGQTSCPFEDEKKTRFYEPGKHTLAVKTMQIEIPRITTGENNLKSQKIINIPSGSAANFTLNLDNLSETNENVWFNMYVVDETNPDGAALSIDGVPFATARQILVNALETTHKNLQIRQTRTDIMKYDSIAVVLSSNCQEEIADTIYLSVEFVPSCSPLTLQIDDRTMNSSTGDTLQLIVKDFEKDYLNFNEIRLQYKGERDNDWNLAKKLMVEDLDGARQVVSFPMSSNLFNDQTYQFRAISVCAKGASEIITNESETINLIKDMARPQVLGTPNPSDGILDAGDEISVTYNEDIRNSILSKGDNFVIEAVLNDAEVDHNVALKMDSTSNFAAATEASIGLANKSFTVDMWVNLSSGGTLLKHGSDKEYFTVSVASTGKLTVNVNGTKVTSSDKIPFNKWCFLTLSYNLKSDSSAAVSALVAYDAEEVSLLVDKKLPKYGATETLSLGKNIRGAIGEVALWGTKRSNAESQSQMHFAKSASTENLIGYWKFNEGHGKVAKDVARSRNMALTSDSWYLNNTNFAATLDGKSQLSLDITRSTALSSDDYMMEMWFRGNSQKNATLWSANTKVALKFNANGYLTLLTDSVENQLSTANYLDGAWHHVAMNVLRNGTTTIYMDGSIVKQLSSSKVPALQASELTIGAQRYSPSYAVYDYTDFFKGDVDEVRYWVATFNAKAIDQFRYIRLNGDEAGLEAYYPFEDITKDAGITGYEFALKDMSANAIGKAKGTAKKAASAPALQAKPNMSKLNYSFVASERTVDITLNENASRLEGTTVNFTVKNVRDANNNFSLPVTWSAYINQNRLIWGDDAISLEKNVEDETSFSLSVVNQGAATESWSISNLPSWLTASKNNGSLSALKSETIEFEISNAVPTGSYEETIYLVGNEGISVPFTINLKVNVGKPDWSVDPSQFENSMSVIAQLKLDGNYSTDTEDLVAAFINGTCVGVASPKYYSRYDAYFVSLDIYGNSTDADKKVVFKAWDASTGVTYPTLSTSSNIKFSSNALFGSMKEPVILSSNKMQEQNLDLKKGWNWISLNVKPSNDSINAVFGDIANKANILKSKTNFSQSNGKEFSGALKNVKIGSMYKAQMNTAINYQVAGNAIDASKETVTIKSGWNWIGFNSTTTMSLNEAFADLNPVDGDMVKGQSGFAYYEGYEWVGTLTALNPGKGYMYKSVAKDNRSFKYPAKTSSLRALISKETTKETAYKTENETAYSGNMTIVAVVKDGNKVLDDVQIGIFDAKGKCRAAAATDDKSLAFLTVMGGESADALTIKVIYNGYEYVLEQDLVYADDATLGTLSNPYVIQLTPVDAITDVLNTSISVYPTLVETELNVKAESLTVTNYSISDISGRILINDEPNNSEFTINVSSLSQGAYILMMETEAGTIIKRFSKK